MRWPILALTAGLSWTVTTAAAGPAAQPAPCAPEAFACRLDRLARSWAQVTRDAEAAAAADRQREADRASLRSTLLPDDPAPLPETRGDMTTGRGGD